MKISNPKANRPQHRSRKQSPIMSLDSPVFRLTQSGYMTT